MQLARRVPAVAWRPRDVSGLPSVGHRGWKVPRNKKRTAAKGALARKVPSFAIKTILELVMHVYHFHDNNLCLYIFIVLYLKCCLGLCLS